MSDSIVVTGATGVVGRELIPQLVAAGQQVRTLVRDSSRADFHPSVEVARGDLQHAETLGPVFSGAPKAFVLVSGPDIFALEANAFEAAARAGVGTSSNFRRRRRFRNTWRVPTTAKAHQLSEARLRNLGVAWTMLRPGFFASNADHLPAEDADGRGDLPADRRGQGGSVWATVGR